MKIQGAMIKEQGVNFAIVVVKRSAMTDRSTAEETSQSIQSQIVDFQGIPLVLASQDVAGVFEYFGRDDIVKFLANIDPARIPWMEYDVS